MSGGYFIVFFKRFADVKEQTYLQEATLLKA